MLKLAAQYMATELSCTRGRCKKQFECSLRVRLIFTSPAAAVAKYCDEYVCMSVCLSVCPREYLRNQTRDLYQIFVHVAYVRGSVLLRHVDDRPHRLSAGRG